MKTMSVFCYQQNCCPLCSLLTDTFNILLLNYSMHFYVSHVRLICQLLKSWIPTSNFQFSNNGSIQKSFYIPPPIKTSFEEELEFQK